MRREGGRKGGREEEEREEEEGEKRRRGGEITKGGEGRIGEIRGVRGGGERNQDRRILHYYSKSLLLTLQVVV